MFVLRKVKDPNTLAMIGKHRMSCGKHWMYSVSGCNVSDRHHENSPYNMELATERETPAPSPLP